ncbi:hypothetical protein BKA61DRAFT_572242 [Leptodontidium sp. MPI-SDFR-AT-0119]|nr:hypothetical protein BKA61DRAFT_572242 [Leptodontidium sp. MPI-SDFR-AT-0119]
MLSTTCILLAAIATTVNARSISPGFSLMARDGLCGEKAAKLYYGQSGSPAAMLTMPSTSPFECAEWTLYEAGTVLVLAKHIDPKIKTAVLFEHIANTIDGGESGPPASSTDYVLSCETNGGSLGVKVDTTRPKYSTTKYLTSRAKISSISIKIVRAG